MKKNKNCNKDSFSYSNTKLDGWIAFIILALVSVVFLIPILWAFTSSFKSDVEIQQAGGFLLIPDTWTLENYKELLNFNNKQLPIYKWFYNSIIVSSSQTVIAVIIYSMSAYAYAKMKFKGRDAIFLSMLFLSSFPPIANVIPLYKIMHIFGWLNGPLALIVPGLAGVMNIFLIRQFMYAIPDEFLEAARIDGAGEFKIYSSIILPSCKPILVVVALFTFTGSWNDFLWPSIAINNIDNLTLTAGLQLVKGIFGTLYVAKMSTVATISIVPMIILYFTMQKYFANGISLSSGVKG